MNKHTLLYPAAGLLALAVSPLFAQQQDGAPAPPAEPAQSTPADEAEEQAVEPTEQSGDTAEEADPETLEAPDADAVEDEPAAELQVERQVVLQQAVVVQGNAVRLGFDGRAGARHFATEIANLNNELTLGAVVDGVTTDDNPTAYRFEAEGPGLLTVAVRSKNDDDMTIEVYDERGTQLARCDIDFAGNGGAEHLAVPLSAAGMYRVVIDPLGNGGPYWMGASWLAFEELEAMAPATPDDATEVTPGQAQQGQLAAGGAVEEWFTFTAPAAGLFVFSTSADRGDLVIETYADGRFDQAMDYSDQDRNGRASNERILRDMTEGETIYLKVRPLSGAIDLDYTVRSQFVEIEE